MVFVFGSNEQGKHGGGAAGVASRDHGAVWGQAEGRMGNSYAIPTCKHSTRYPGYEIPVERVKEYVDTFLAYAIAHPEEEFQVTRVGCGLAGFSDSQVAPLFAGAPKNCQFDTEWQPYLGDAVAYWGTY